MFPALKVQHLIIPGDATFPLVFQVRNQKRYGCEPLLAVDGFIDGSAIGVWAFKDHQRSYIVMLFSIAVVDNILNKLGDFSFLPRIIPLN